MENYGKNGCLDCIHFQHTQTVIVGKKEHKLPNGQVFMIEPVYGVKERHCPLHPEIFNEYWEKNRNLSRYDENATEPDCEDFDLPESAKELHNLLEETENLLKKLKNEKTDL